MESRLFQIKGNKTPELRYIKEYTLKIFYRKLDSRRTIKVLPLVEPAADMMELGRSIVLYHRVRVRISEIKLILIEIFIHTINIRHIGKKLQ